MKEIKLPFVLGCHDFNKSEACITYMDMSVAITTTCSICRRITLKEIQYYYVYHAMQYMYMYMCWTHAMYIMYM